MITKELYQKLKPSFYAEDVNFIPRPAHVKEDAGADLKLYIPKQDPVGRAILDALSESYNFICVDGNLTATKDAVPEVKKKGGFEILFPGKNRLFNVGFKIALPTVEEIYPFLPVYKIVSRSGLSCKYKVSVTNRPGIIDKGYRDWVRVSLENEGDYVHVFTHGARIAQGLYELVIDQGAWDVDSMRVSELTDSKRGEGGFGSTGLKN
jgi:dUTP pyrophosphatase